MNHYYAFVDLLPSSVSNAIHPYKYNGKELDRKKGIDWYDYGARMYDATLGGWTTIDPQSEKLYTVSPYTYCINDPIKHRDPDGEVPLIAGLIGVELIILPRLQLIGWKESLGRNPLLM